MVSAFATRGVYADVLVTGDRDLLDIVADLPVKIVNPRGFWDLVRKIE